MAIDTRGHVVVPSFRSRDISRVRAAVGVRKRALA
jgi:hypothetical protein